MSLSYRQALEAIKEIMEKDAIQEEIERIFNHYAENVVNSDEAAAVLTLAEILKGKEGHPSAKEGHSSE